VSEKGSLEFKELSLTFKELSLKFNELEYVGTEKAVQLFRGMLSPTRGPSLDEYVSRPCLPGTKFLNEQVRLMIGIILVTHGRLASEFRAALEHVVGPQKQIESVGIGPDDDIEQRREEIISAVAQVDSGSGVVVLTDMFGGTPSNLAISIMNGAHIEVIAGVNLPMLIKLASVRDSASLEQAVCQAQDAGRKYIYVASKFLGGK
jgi:mannose PTS system EIIA component